MHASAQVQQDGPADSACARLLGTMATFNRNSDLYLAAALTVLQQAGKPLHYIEVAERMLAGGFVNPTGGDKVQTANNVYAYMNQSARYAGEHSPIRFHRSGVFSARSVNATDEQATAAQPRRNLSAAQARAAQAEAALAKMQAEQAEMRRLIADLQKKQAGK